MNIRTIHICPPIPIRRYDWCAYNGDTFDAESSKSLVGYGCTEQEAIADLLQLIAEANDVNDDGA
jgi:hypothetical protein